MKYKTIGVIHSPYEEPKGTPIQPPAAEDINGIVEVFQEYTEGLKDVEGFSHIILIYPNAKNIAKELLPKKIRVHAYLSRAYCSFLFARTCRHKPRLDIKYLCPNRSTNLILGLTKKERFTISKRNARHILKKLADKSLLVRKKVGKTWRWGQCYRLRK